MYLPFHVDERNHSSEKAHFLQSEFEKPITSFSINQLPSNFEGSKNHHLAIL